VPEVEGTFRLNPQQARAAAKHKGLHHSAIKLAGMGTKDVGYVVGLAPYDCEHCDWETNSGCDHPSVNASPLITKIDRLPDGRPIADGRICCNVWWKRNWTVKQWLEHLKKHGDR
jgi:hypothetical protein